MASSHRALFDSEVGLVLSAFHTAASSVESQQPVLVSAEEESHSNWVPSLVRMTEAPVVTAVGRISRALRRDAWLNNWAETWPSRRKREQPSAPGNRYNISSPTEKTTVNATYIAVHETHGHCWTQLLRHYPMDVLLVLSFYRSMLLRWNTYEGMLENGCGTQKEESRRLMPLGGLGDVRSCFSMYQSAGTWLELASGCASQGQVDLLGTILSHSGYPCDLEELAAPTLISPAFHGNHPTTVKFLMDHFGNAHSDIVVSSLLPRTRTPEMLRVVLRVPPIPDEAKQGQLNELLLQAVKQGWVSLAQCLVAVGAEVPTGEVLDRAFRDAIDIGNVEMLQFYLWLVSRDETRSPQQRAALATHGLQCLFANPGCFPKSDWQTSRRSNSMTILHILIEGGADVNDAQQPPLMLALRQNLPPDTISALVREGAKLKLGSNTQAGETTGTGSRVEGTGTPGPVPFAAIAVAARYSSPNVIEVLLNDGADPRDCPLSVATTAGSLRLLKAVLEVPEVRTRDVPQLVSPIPTKEWKDDVTRPAAAKLMLAAGTASRARNFRASDGGTLLHMIGNDVAMARVLVAFLHGPAFLNAVDHQGRSALHVAALQDHVSIIELLLNTHSFNVEAVDSTGKTAQEYARSMDAKYTFNMWRTMTMPQEPTSALQHGRSSSFRNNRRQLSSTA